MTLTLGTIITAARDRSPSFYPTRVTNAVVARYLSDVQNELIGAALRRDPQYIAQTANIVLNLSASDAPGAVGVGTVGGLPGVVDAAGGFAVSESTAGALIEANLDPANGATVIVPDTPVTSSTATVLTRANAARPINADMGRVLVITAGTGRGQMRVILSNTATDWTISTGTDGRMWTTTPDGTSMFRVVAPAYGSDNGIGVVTAVPSVSTTNGYLVRLDSVGTPFIDFTAPLVATMDAGVPLPSMQFPLDAACWYTDGTSGPLHICAADRRFAPQWSPAVYVQGQTLYLTGEAGDWSDVASIALRYAPIAPAFSALTDVFLLLDHARPALIAKAASFMAMVVNGTEGVTIDPAAHHTESARAEAAFLSSVSAAKRGRRLQVRDIL